MSPPAYRPDIDGLRAVAITLVILYHAFPRLCPGGFIGVDVFFVISGYLISGIILKDIQKGSFSFLHFYARRFRRIAPALTTVLLTVWATGWLLLLPERFLNLGRHVIAGASFTSNFLLLREVGYFDTAAEYKPLLHLWSLGIEEQFYLLWPPLLLLACRWRSRATLVIGLLFGLSFLTNLAWTTTGYAFYLLPARFWELLIGCWLAYGERAGMREQASQAALPLVANLKAVLAVAVLLWAALRLNKDLPYPGWYALLPTLAAALLISSSSRASWINRKVLASTPAVWLGLISYPLYLWHWPLLSFPPIVIGMNPGVALRCGLVIVALLLAWLTRRCIELPVQRDLFAAQPALRRDRALVVTAVAALGVLGTLGYLTCSRDGFRSRFADRDVAVDDLGNLKYDIHVAEMNLNHEVCAPYPGFPGWCETNNKDHMRYALYGDSHGEHYVLGLLGAATRQDGWLFLGRAGCPAVANLEVKEAGLDGGCQEFHRQSLRVLADHPEISTVVLSSMTTPYFVTPLPTSPYARDGRFKIRSDVYAGTAQDLYRQGLSQTISALQKMGKRVVLVVDNPELPFDMNTCVSSRLWKWLFAAPPRCTLARAEYETRSRAARELLTGMKAAYPSLLVYDPIQFFCDDQVCSPWRNGHSLYRDNDHLSAYGSQLAGAYLLRWLSQQHLDVSTNQPATLDTGAGALYKMPPVRR